MTRTSASPSSEGRRAAEDLADYLLDIGGRLVAQGCPAYRLEDVIAAVGALEGYRAEAFAFPTGLFLSLVAAESPTAPPLLRMRRVRSWGVDLNRLTRIDEIFNSVAARKTSIEEARRALRELDAHATPYPPALRWAATAAVSGAAGVFFRGGPREVGLAACLGVIVGAFGGWVSKNPQGRYLADFFGAFVAAVLSWVASTQWGVSHEVLVLSSIIALVPGMTFTTGLAELAQKNLVAGGARLMDALMTFLSLVFGIALALGIETARPGLVVERRELGLPWQALALTCAALASAVLFAVPRRFVWAALVSGATGYVATFVGTKYLPGHVAAFVASLAVCVLANVLARTTKRPAQLFQLPGMLLLVPGSFGFLSLEDFLRGEIVAGAAKGFQMVLVACGLVIGVLLANVIVPAKKLL